LIDRPTRTTRCRPRGTGPLCCGSWFVEARVPDRLSPPSADAERSTRRGAALRLPPTAARQTICRSLLNLASKRRVVGTRLRFTQTSETVDLSFSKRDWPKCNFGRSYERTRLSPRPPSETTPPRATRTAWRRGWRRARARPWPSPRPPPPSPALRPRTPGRWWRATTTAWTSRRSLRPTGTRPLATPTPASATPR